MPGVFRQVVKLVSSCRKAKINSLILNLLFNNEMDDDSSINLDARWFQHYSKCVASVLTTIASMISAFHIRGLHWVWAPVGPNANLTGAGGFTFAAGGQNILRENRGERWDLA